MIIQSRHGRYSMADFAIKTVQRDPRDEGLSLPANRGDLTDANTARSELTRLRETTGAVALLYDLVHARIPGRSCIAVSQGQADLPAALSIGNREPLGTDAPGLVILAHLDSTFPPNPRIRRIRSDGYARTASRAAGWQLLSAPILCPNGPVGAIGLSASPQAMEEGLPEFISATMSAAARISRSLANLSRSGEDGRDRDSA